MRGISFLIDNYQIFIVSSVIIISVLYFYREKFIFDEHKNDEF